MHIIRNKNSGFTIVELLIVVVVIAILAAITIVAYNGISTQAKESALKADLKNASTQLHVVKTRTGEFPANANNLQKSEGTTFIYSGDDNTFCISASNSTALPDKSFYVTENGTIEEGDCSPSEPPLPVVTTMQTFTSAHCAAQPVFTGSNEDAIIELTDSRGGTTQTYQVAKLADNKCWMLTNLKLGSTTSSITLNSTDSDVTGSFALPRVANSGTANYDTPGVYGPVTSSGSGASNYGYLYNWPAATAGESTSSMGIGSGNADNSICPANWRLPTGGAIGEFAMLNAKMNNPSATSPSTSSGTGYYQNWHYTGPFRGVLSGYWINSFLNQNVYGYLWSSSVSDSSAVSSLRAYFDAGSINTSDASNRRSGFGVRCILN